MVYDSLLRMLEQPRGVEALNSPTDHYCSHVTAADGDPDPAGEASDVGGQRRGLVWEHAGPSTLRGQLSLEHWVPA